MSGLSSGMGIELGSDTKAQSSITYLAASTNPLPETAGEGAVAATLSIIGDEYVAPASFIITSDPSGFFEIVGDELRVNSGASFDYETTSSYPVTIEGTDGALNTYSKTAYVPITNINEAPTSIQLSSNLVDENAVGVYIGTLTASDVDVGDSAAFSITADASGFFEIIGGNQIWAKVSATFDYEIATSHDVTIQVSDGGALTFFDTFTINVNNINEAPLDISLNATAISESASIGDTIATISSSGDPDVGDSATYTITNDPDNKFLISGTDLKLNGALDYATATSHNLTIRVTDGGSLFYDELFTIDVTEVSGFDINALPNLLFNLDSNFSTITISTGDQVSQIDDLGPLGNDATQSTSSSQPLTGGSLNGLNALSFDGVNDRFLIPDTAIADFSFFVALSYISGSGSRVVFNNSQLIMFFNSSQNLRTVASTGSSSFTASDNTPMVVGMVGSKTGGGTFYVNGSTAGTWTGTLSPQASTSLGYGSNIGQAIQMQFGQAVYCTEQLSAQNITDLQTKLLAEWTP